MTTPGMMSGTAGASKDTGTLMLDPDIRDWVVLPLFVIMVAAGLLRHGVGQLLQREKQKISSYIVKRAQNTLQQVNRIRSGNIHYISTTKWYNRKRYYIQLLKDEATWCIEEDRRNKEQQEMNGNDSGNGGSGSNDADDPLSMMGGANPMDMMKGSMVFMVQNMIMMQGIQYFFSGFILLKVPFPLTVGFKSMFQRGVIDLPDLNSSYVSSVSWYFLVMYGLRQFFRLAIGEPIQELKEQDRYLAQLGYINPPNPQQQQKQNDIDGTSKNLRQEAENMELFFMPNPNFKSELDNVEKRLLGKQRYPKRHDNKAGSVMGGLLSSDDDTDPTNLLLGGVGAGGSSSNARATSNSSHRAASAGGIGTGTKKAAGISATVSTTSSNNKRTKSSKKKIKE